MYIGLISDQNFRKKLFVRRKRRNLMFNALEKYVLDKIPTKGGLYKRIILTDNHILQKARVCKIW